MRSTALERLRENIPAAAADFDDSDAPNAAATTIEEQIDCGIKVLNCCNTTQCRQLGTTRTFLVVLILLAVVQGISEKYIAISAQQAALEHDFNPDVVEWLLVSGGIIQGIFAILIAYWGNRIHKITWLCGMIAFQSVTSILIIFPTLTHSESSSQSTFNVHSVNMLCSNHMSASLSLGEIPHSITTLIGLFLLQTGISYGFIGFYTLGLTYLDDNALEQNIPALIGAALAGRYIGFLLGNGLSLFTNFTSLGWWLGWTIISPILLIIAVFIGLFPRRMLETVIRESTDTAPTNSNQIRAKFLSDVSFFHSLSRIFRNKILLLNVFATVFIQTALINFALQEQNYLQSRFLLPIDDSNILNNEWTSRTLSKLIQPFIVALAVLLGGLVIAKTTPSARKIVAWNAITALIVCLLFVGYIFIECSHNSIAGVHGNKLALPYCSRGCVCDSDIRFTPVCPDKSAHTFFSPCHAGCATEQVVNGQRIFGNCSCGIEPDMTLINEYVSTASEGACGYESCQKIWIIFQILTAFGAVCVGSRLVGKILISIRSVLLQDTAIALALELTFVGLIAYIPGQFVYKYIADTTCTLWSQNQSVCLLHDSRDFGNIVNIYSAALALIAVILELIILFVAKDLQLYGIEAFSEIPAVEMQTISRRHTEEPDASATIAESNQPLLSGHENVQQQQPPPQQTKHQQNIPLTISSPIQQTIAGSGIPTQSGTVTEVTQSMSNRVEISNHSPKPPHPMRYSPVYKMSQTHIEELNFRLQSLNHRVHVDLCDSGPNAGAAAVIASGDINPSVGSDNDKESDLNIQQLESSVSSLSGLPTGSSTVNSPEATHSQRKMEEKSWRVERYETDF